MAYAQQAPAKPVLSATPPAAAAAPLPAAVKAPAVAPAGSSPVAVDPSYVIGPDDSIQVNVWKEPTFTEGVLVRPDGMISMPAIGDIPAAGRTPMQLADDITALLKKFVIDPTVTVTVLAVNSKRVYLSGEVGHVGPIPMSANMTVLEAIDSAGGLDAYANKKRIYILRQVNGQKQTIPFDYKKAIKTGNMQGITLQPGDMIVVP